MKNSIKLLGLLLLISVTFSGLAQTMQDDMEYLASDKLEGREFGSHGALVASKYISKRFKKLGLEPKGTDGYFQELSVKPRYNPHAKVPVDTSKAIIGRNVIGYIDNGAATTVIIGAHYDHLGFGAEGSLYEGDEKLIHNGADDNASGVTVMLQLADWIRGQYPHNNYLFIAFSGEEKGLWGSSWFTKNPTIDLATINYMINMDMVGRLDAEKNLAVYGTGTSPIWHSLIEGIGKDQGFIVKYHPGGIGPSDHTSFYLKDMPVLHFFTGQHADYHKPSDDFDKINYDGMIEVQSFIESVIAQVDSKGKIEFIKTKDEDSKKAPKYSVTLGVIPDYMYDGKGMLISGVKEGRAADKAGIINGDIVIKMGDVEVRDMMAYMEALGKFKKGDKVKVIVKRGEEKVEVEVEF
ncbi:MAG: peptidase M28 [Bacteroidetes bacterium]|nr:MAG: peptidase M28 [Bacteroidota bacterium]